MPWGKIPFHRLCAEELTNVSTLRRPPLVRFPKVQGLYPSLQEVPNLKWNVGAYFRGKCEMAESIGSCEYPPRESEKGTVHIFHLSPILECARESRDSPAG